MHVIIMRTTIAICILFLASTCVAAEPIYLGASLPLTGQSAAYGEVMKNGIALAVDEINTAGGILNRPLQVVFEDSQGQSDMAKKIARKFTLDKRIVASIGDFTSGACLAAQPVYHQAGLVQFSPTASHPSFAPGSPYSFGISGTQAQKGAFSAQIAVKTLEKTRIAVLYLGTEWGAAAQKFFAEEAARLGATIVASESYLEGATDFLAALEKLRAAKPDLIYLCSLVQDGAAILQQRQQMGWTDVTVLGTTTLYSPEIIKLTGTAAENLYTTTDFFPEATQPQIQQFVKSYQGRFRDIPEHYAALSYDALNMLALAIKHGGAERQAIRDTLANFEDFAGVSGNMTFTENRDVLKNYVILQIVNGQFHVVQAQ